MYLHQSQTLLYGFCLRAFSWRKSLTCAHHVAVCDCRASGLIPYIIYTNPVYKPESTGFVRVRRSRVLGILLQGGPVVRAPSTRGETTKEVSGHASKDIPRPSEQITKKAVLFKTASSHIEQYLLLTKLEVFLRVSIADTLYYFTDAHHILRKLAFGNILTEQVTDDTAEVLMTRERQEAA